MGKLVNRAKMTVASAPGTGPVTLGGAAPGFQAFGAAGVNDGDVVSYVMEDGLNWELGQGTYTAAGTVLTRTTILSSSNAGAAINASAGAKLFVSPLAADLAVPDARIPSSGLTPNMLAKWQASSGTLTQTVGLFETGSGIVGVGTTQPGNYNSKLQVLGTNAALTSTILVTNSNWVYGTFGSGLAIGHSAGTGNTASRLQALYVGGNGVGILNLNDLGGNVGVNMSAPVCALDVAGPVRAKSYTVATLPAASLGDGMAAYVSDATGSAKGAAAAGGGSIYTPVYSRSSVWYYG